MILLTSMQVHSESSGEFLDAVTSSHLKGSSTHSSDRTQRLHSESLSLFLDAGTFSQLPSEVFVGCSFDGKPAAP